MYGLLRHHCRLCCTLYELMFHIYIHMSVHVDLSVWHVAARARAPLRQKVPALIYGDIRTPPDPVASVDVAACRYRIRASIRSADASRRARAPLPGGNELT